MYLQYVFMTNKKKKYLDIMYNLIAWQPLYNTVTGVITLSLVLKAKKHVS